MVPELLNVLRPFLDHGTQFTVHLETKIGSYKLLTCIWRALYILDDSAVLLSSTRLMKIFSFVKLDICSVTLDIPLTVCFGLLLHFLQ